MFYLYPFCISELEGKGWAVAVGLPVGEASRSEEGIIVLVVGGIEGDSR